ncbi:hypothetical protein J6X73_02575 [Candidatus Saccharibacteria bacterium]|nr:hypothetical protein [Candidatus Saccharibacteria bacterium]
MNDPKRKEKKQEASSHPTDPERLHLKNEPHAAPGEYDPKNGYYRTNGG